MLTHLLKCSGNLELRSVKQVPIVVCLFVCFTIVGCVFGFRITGTAIPVKSEIFPRISICNECV